MERMDVFMRSGDGAVSELASQRVSSESAVVRHFFPWWMEEAYVGAPVGGELREDEQRLMLAHGLTAGQIGFRRGLEASYRGLRSQEFAEDAESCFKATGECCFEVEAVEARLAAVGEPMEMRRGGALQVWLPPLRGRSIWLRWIRLAVGPMGTLLRCR